MSNSRWSMLPDSPDSVRSGESERSNAHGQTSRSVPSGTGSSRLRTCDTRKALHEAFWRGEGPSLILIPAGDVPLYDTSGYCARFHDPAKMWEADVERARPVIDRPTDGIPTVRPNLGTIFVPALAGQECMEMKELWHDLTL